MILTWIIIGITAAVSIAGFQNHQVIQKLQFNAVQIIHRKQYYRMISHAFVHANWPHLIVNMLVLYFFGRNVEYYFDRLFDNRAGIYYLVLYIGGILASNIYSLVKHKNNYYYNAVGASGAVSAVLFAEIFFSPLDLLYFFGIVPIPGILFAIGYLFYSYYMGKRQSDNVAHDAHFLGAIFGFVLPIILKPDLFSNFIDQLFSFL